MYCPNCGHKNEDGSRFCEACGQKLSEEIRTEPEPIPEFIQEPVPEPMPEFIQEPVPEPTPEPEPQKFFCPECGCEIVDSTSVFCPNCGKNLREAGQAVENTGGQEQELYQEPPLMEFEPWEEEPRPKKKSNVLLIVLGIVAVILAAAVALCAVWYIKLSNEPENDAVTVSSEREEDKENSDRKETESQSGEETSKEEQGDEKKKEDKDLSDSSEADEKEKEDKDLSDSSEEKETQKKETSDSSENKKNTDEGAESKKETADSSKDSSSESKKETNESAKKESSATTAKPTAVPTAAPTPTPTEAPKKHSYEIIMEDCTWEEARQRCIERGGYLARIETEEEFDELTQSIEAAGLGDKMFMIGARRDEAGSLYYWADDQNILTGEALNDPASPLFGRWMAGEPSFGDQGNPECYVDIFYFKDEGRWVMNDVMNDIVGAVPSYSGRVGYICEYEE